MSKTQNRLYKIKLLSGRVIGPIDIKKIAALVVRGHITGKEVARTGSNQPWSDINRFEEIRNIILDFAQGKLIEVGKTPIDPDAKTILIESPDLLKEEPDKTHIVEWGSDEPTEVIDSGIQNSSSDANAQDLVEDWYHDPVEDLTQTGLIQPLQTVSSDSHDEENIINSNEKTQILPRARSQQKVAKNKRRPLFVMLILVLIILVLEENKKEDEAKQAKTTSLKPISARLPAFNPRRPSPEKSEELYKKGLSLYLLDRIPAYKEAIKYLEKAVAADIQNVKAMSMLASCYLQLLEVSIRDEEYFSVINKLIEISRSKNIDFAESVIADVELNIALNRPFAGEKRIVEFTEKNSTKDVVLFYYFALTQFYRGDYTNSLHYLSLIPEERWFSPRVPYLIAQNFIANKQGDKALSIIDLILKKWPGHYKSKLKKVQILERSGRFSQTLELLNDLSQHPEEFSKADRAEIAYLRSRYFFGIEKNPTLASQEILRAVAINAKNPEYLIEYYTIMRHLGEGKVSKEAERDAKMYYYLGEGEKKFVQGNFKEALTDYLSARDINIDSAAPLVKIGELFYRNEDYSNAKLNFEKAIKREPGLVDALSKYVRVLIKMNEWEEAKQNIQKMTGMNVSQSTLERIYGEFYSKQGLLADAQGYYKAAMSRETIDAEVYSGFADNLTKMGKPQEAAFYYALSLRYDPSFWPAVHGSIKALSLAKGYVEAHAKIKDYLKLGSIPPQNLQTLQAEVYIEQNEFSEAQRVLNQTLQTYPDYAEVYRVLGHLYLKLEGRTPDATKRALEAFRSYSDRVPSDPSGYLERFKIFLRDHEYAESLTELKRVETLYPKYLNLHYYYGLVYRQTGEAQKSVDSFQKEVEFHPYNVRAQLALGQALIQSNPTVAAPIFQKSMQLAPNDAEPKEWLGYAHYLNNNPQAAIMMYQSALALDKGRVTLYRRMGEAYEALGDLPKARGFYQRYLDLAPDASDRDTIYRKLSN